MAITFVHGAQGSGAGNTSQTITSATAGHRLFAFIAETGTTTNAPTGSDNISGSTGWSTYSQQGLYNAGAASTWIATKTAVGGETTITPTAGVGGTIAGVGAIELSGASATLDGSIHVLNNQSSATDTIPATSGYSTLNAGSIVICWVYTNSSSGTVTPGWSGTGPMTPVSTATTRTIIGYYIPGTTVSLGAYTVGWTTSRANAMMYMAIQPSGAATANGNFLPFF